MRLSSSVGQAWCTHCAVGAPRAWCPAIAGVRVKPSQRDDAALSSPTSQFPSKRCFYFMQDVAYSIPAKAGAKHTIITGITGYIEPGKMTAVVRPTYSFYLKRLSGCSAVACAVATGLGQQLTIKRTAVCARDTWRVSHTSVLFLQASCKVSLLLRLQSDCFHLLLRRWGPVAAAKPPSWMC